MSKRRKLLIVLCAITTCFSAGSLFLKRSSNDKAKPMGDNMGGDFESLMGKGTSRWEFVQTKEDFENLKFFKSLYDTKKMLVAGMSKRIFRVPKVVHFIWLGPKPFPRESVENVRSWIAKHPDWTIKFWTDRE